MLAAEKKLFCVIGQLGNGGTEKQLFLFLKYLDRKRFQPTVIVSNAASGDKWRGPIEGLGVEVIELGGRSRIGKLLYFRKLVKRYVPDLVFSWSFFTNAFCLVCGKTPFIGSLRGGLDEERGGLSRPHFQAALKPGSFVVNSEALRFELSQENIVIDRIRKVRNLFVPRNWDPGLQEIRKELRAKYGFADNDVVLCGMGRDSTSKDFAFWAEIFGKLCEEHDCIRGLLMGKGPEAISRTPTFNESIAKGIVITGEVPDGSRELAAADIFLISSHSEGLPNCLLEAIDAGVLVVCTDTGGGHEMFQKRDATLLEKLVFTHGDTVQAVERLSQLINDPNYRSELQSQTTECLKMLSPENVMQDFYGVFDDLLRSRKSA